MFKHSISIFSITFINFFISVNASLASDLPDCPPSGYFNNCFGTMTYSSGEKYVGEWKDGKSHGYGTYTYPDGDQYVGEYKDDKKNGHGTYTWTDGKQYVGEWKDGERNGPGIQQWSDESLYVGNWENNERNGLGIESYPDKNIYIGEWKKSDRNGQGYFIWADGDADFCTYKINEHSNCSGSNVQNVAPVLQKEFTFLDWDIRRLIQQILKADGIYNSALDGEWGKDTFIALATFSVLKMNTIDFNTRTVVKEIFSEIVNAKLEEEIEPAQKNGNSIANGPDPSEILNVASGTGFFISDKGHIITNHHVINGCIEVKIHTVGNASTATILANDQKNDLALLKVSQSPEHVFALSNEDPYPLQDIIVAGFPFGDAVSSTLKFTTGVISSLAGIGNNYSEIQIDAAIQPGNSGGPILDNRGNIVGVAVSKLDIDKVYEDFGVIPENTNFGIKASVVKNLLQSYDVKLKSPNKSEIPKSQLSKVTTKGTLHLSCWMTMSQIENMQSQKVMFEKFDLR